MAHSKVKSLSIVITGGALLFAGSQLCYGSPKFYSDVAMPALRFCTSAETAHNIAIKLSSKGLVPKSRFESSRLTTDFCGHSLSNPIGLAAGMDKHLQAIDGLLKIGFGFLEVGGVTPKPQPGNPQPRVFRLPEDDAVINRYGFNSIGHEAAAQNFKQFRARNGTSVVGINLGKNKDSQDPSLDYVQGVPQFGPYADFLVVNVSSPNTPGLRKLQGKESLSKVVHDVTKARDDLRQVRKPPIFIKIAPDLTEQDKTDIASVILEKNSGVAGLVVSNTTLARPSTLINANRNETGGLSGAPLREKSTQLIRDMYKLTKGSVTIIGVGGVFTGRDALEKIEAGASVVQVYTAMTYHGPPVVDKIKRELNNLLAEKGYDNVQQAVGADHRVDQ